MLIFNHGFKRKYVYGGAGLFDSVVNFFTRLFSSGVATKLASASASAALQAGRSVATDAGKKTTTIITVDDDDVDVQYDRRSRSYRYPRSGQEIKWIRTENDVVGRRR